MREPTLARTTLVVAAVLLHAAAVSAATFTVTVVPDPDCSDGACDLQSALTTAQSNSEDDVLELPDTTGLPGGSLFATTTFTYTSTGDFDLAITGSATGRTILHGNDTAQILSIVLTSGSELDPTQISISKVTFRNGSSGGADGAGLAVSTRHADVTVEDCSFLGNDAGPGGGGGVWIGAWEFGSGTATIVNNSFRENRAGAGAGLELSFPGIVVEDNRFASNRLTASGEGGGASVVGNSGPVTVSDNFFWRNHSADGVEGCRGGGLYLSSGSLGQVSVVGNAFEQNGLGHDGSGAGAFVTRMVGPLIVESNIFDRNTIDGTAEGTGGGGLRASLFGSGAAGTFVNNVFADNQARLVGTAVWIASLDVGVLFANNTAVFNIPRCPTALQTGSSAVVIDSPQVDLYNNIMWGNGPLGNDLLVLDGFTTEEVTLRNNDIGTYSLPAVVILDEGGNISVDPDIASHYPRFHLMGTSPAVDTGVSYGGMPATDVQGEGRVADGDGDGTAEVDMGADELGGWPLLSSDASVLESSFSALGALQSDSTAARIENAGSEPFEVTDIRFDVDSLDWSLELVDSVIGSTVDPHSSASFEVEFRALSLEDSRNTLVVETSAGTVTRRFFGDYEPPIDTDDDGVSDRDEWLVGDANCDGIDDMIQSHVASFYRIPHRVTIVAPTESIGSLGHFYPPGVTPFLRNVSTLPAPDEGGGPLVRDFPMSFVSFDVTTSRGVLGAGGYFPVSIILSAAAFDEVDGYVKRGLVPADFPPSLIRPDGTWDFVLEPGSSYPWLWRVGAVVENDVLVCGELRPVVHLRLYDGELGDGDLFADGTVRDPGGAALMPVDNGKIGDTVWCDSDLDGTLDPGEGATSVTVLLHDDADCDGAPDALRATQSTAVDGTYLFTNVPVGAVAAPACYVVEVDVAGLGTCNNPITPVAHTVSLTDAAWTDVDGDFGFIEDLDYGDLPPIYGLTLRAEDGGRHGAGASLMLGTCVDLESDGRPDALAQGDDTNDTGCVDDEGMIMPTGNWTDGSGEFDIVDGVNGDGCLNVWLDFTDGSLPGPDGDFADSDSGISEWVVQNREVDASTFSVSFALPIGLPVAGHELFMRTRLTPRDGAGGCADAEAYVSTAAAAVNGAAVGGMIVDTRVEGATVPVELLGFGVE